MDKQYLKRVGAVCLTVVICIGLAVYFGFHLYLGLTTEVEVKNASAVTVTLLTDCTGYIMKSETLLKGDNSGRYAPLVSDGTKVGVGDAVSVLYSSYDSEIIEEINLIDSQIKLLEDSKTDGTQSLKNTGMIDSEIFKTLVAMRNASLSGRYDISASQEEALVTLLMRRDIITGAVSAEEAIKGLYSRRESLVANLGSCVESVYIGEGGYFYSTPDGYEEVFSSKNIDKITYSDFKKMTQNSMPNEISSDCCGKLVTDFTWYLAVPASRAVASKYEIDSSVGVIFEYNGGVRLDMCLERILTSAGEDEAVLILSSGEIKAGFDFRRSQPVKLVTEEFEGFRVPVSAVRVIDGKTGVYVLNVYVVEFREIEIIRQESDQYIVKLAPDGETEYGWLSQNDKIIVSGKGLYHGRVLN